VAYSCPVASTCGTIQRSTFYTRADATGIATWGNQFSVSDPEWVTNDRTILFGGAGSQVDLDQLDSGQNYNFKNWFNEPDDTGDGELSRNGRNLVTTYNYGPDLTIVFWSVAGNAATEWPPPRRSTPASSAIPTSTTATRRGPRTRCRWPTRPRTASAR
jgi:hypothetical protein